MKYRELTYPQKWILKGIPVLFIIGSALHFAYETLGNNPIIGLFSPVNESVWEHLKMVVLPVFLWWSLYFLFNGKREKIDKNRWFSGALIALLTSLSVIPLAFYFYTEAFGTQLIFVDILILLLALFCGQMLAFRFYRHCDFSKKGINANITISILIAIVLLFAVFTVYPPQIPLFKEI